MSVAAPKLMTTEELLAIPDDGRRRWLINGELRVQGEPGEHDVTIRNRFHSATMAKITTELEMWRRTLPKPRGEVVCGQAGVRLPGEPETTVGVDVAYVPPDVVISQTDASTIIEGIPTLIVEIISPSDTAEELDEMVKVYLRVGVPMVWLVDPTDRTVTIYRPNHEISWVNATQALDGGDVLPGFRVPVQRFFE